MRYLERHLIRRLGDYACTSHGYDTVVGKRGAKLSTRQQQRHADLATADGPYAQLIAAQRRHA